METFKIRASACGQIMAGTIGLTEKQNKRRLELLERQMKANKDEAKPLTDNMEKELVKLVEQYMNSDLPKTMQTYVKQWLTKKRFGKHKEINSKYLNKGNVAEDESLDLIAEVLGYGMLMKNEEFFEDKFMQGTPDIILPNEIIDAKSSWDVYTFPFYEEELPNDDYFYQGQVYMHLTGRKHFKVVYCLVNTPPHLIEAEARRFAFLNGYDPDDLEIYQRFEKNMTFDDIPKEDRVKVFEFDYDESVIEEIIVRVDYCRQLVEQLNK